MAPDGVPRQMFVYNGQFPGPLIEANWGDTIVVHVTNNLKNNGYKKGPMRSVIDRRTSIHWHGILMEHNVANDGVPGITQCIPPFPAPSLPFPLRSVISLVQAPFHREDHSHTGSEQLATAQPGTTPTSPCNTAKGLSAQ